jgi:Tfp pilus assembly protein PilE
MARPLSETPVPHTHTDLHAKAQQFCPCSLSLQVTSDRDTASAALLEAETALERIHRDVVEVQTKKTLAANSSLVSAASAVLEEQLAAARAQQHALQARPPSRVPV